MKIQAVMPEAVLPAVIERLALIGVEEIIVSSVRATVKLEEIRSFRGVRYTQELADRCALECWPGDDAEPAVRAIRQAVEKSASEAMILVMDSEGWAPT